MEAKLQEEINKLTVIMNAHIYEPRIEAVAEISFKAGYDSRKEEIEALMSIAFKDGEKAGKQEGIKEVVEWIKSNACLERGDCDVGLCFEDYLHFDYHDWQAKLREWGIEK
jgi:hypothetical protein